jgi:hypothetical protein
MRSSFKTLMFSLAAGLTAGCSDPKPVTTAAADAATAPQDAEAKQTNQTSAPVRAASGGNPAPTTDAGTSRQVSGGSGGARAGTGGSAPDAAQPSAPDAESKQTSEPAAPAEVDAALVPWGLASSASTSRELKDWAYTIASTGARWVRGYDPDMLESSLSVLDENKLSLSGILLWSPTPELTLPATELPAWESYVTSTLNQAKGRVRYWEVWNEPPNFTANKSPADYAKVVKTAYQAAKAADPSVKLGIAVQSVNLSYLSAALDAGARDQFDYVTLHPYEVLDLVRYGWEAQYMSIVPTVRKLLADKSPGRKDVPVHFTELGHSVDTLSPEQQAAQLTKAYVLGLAQGVERIHWFEITDGDSGRFGLVDPNGVKRPSFAALRSLVDALGEQPQYLGWTMLAERAYTFVFKAAQGPLAITWAPPDTQLELALDQEVSVLTLGTAKVTRSKSVKLTNAPVLLRGIPDAVVELARASQGKPFPWDGDFSQAKSVAYNADSGAAGLHAIGQPDIVMIDGLKARNVAKATGIAFTVDPNFNAYNPARVRIEVRVRRNTATPASFTLRYESASGFKAAGGLYEIPGSDKWYTQSWEIDDPQFVGMWGYHISLDSGMIANANYSVNSVTVTKL